MEAWRIVKGTFDTAHAFSGLGAHRYGGRWNSKGNRVVYTSGSISLATLELLVHMSAVETRLTFRLYHIEFSEDLIERLDASSLKNWRTEIPTNATIDLGNQWIEEGRSAVLAVPSVIVPSETNYLINPQHADFRQMKIHKPEVHVFDQRLKS